MLKFLFRRKFKSVGNIPAIKKLRTYLKSQHIKTLSNTFEFFKSTLIINLPLSLFASVFGGLSVFVLVFVSFGYLTAITIREVSNTNDYLFYFNNGIPKIQLWFSAYLLSVITAIGLAAVYILILK